MYQAYFAIEKEMKSSGWHGERAELISLFTQGRKSSLKDLTPLEYRRFIQNLNKMNKQEAAAKDDWQKSPENIMRRKLWNLFVKQMNYEPNRFQDWVLKYGKFHKPLQEHNREELTVLVSQAELVYKSFVNEIRK